MKKVVNGKYDDPNSTRSVFEISMEEFDLIKESICHLKNKYSFLMKASEEELRDIIGLTGSSDDFRRDINNDVEALKALEIRIIALILSKSTHEMPELTLHEFRVLIEAISNYCADITNSINLDADSAKESVRQAMNIGKKNTSESEIDKALGKITSKEYKVEAHKKAKILYSILEVINQPYEGAVYFDEMGEKAEPPQKNSSSDIN